MKAYKHIIVTIDLHQKCDSQKVTRAMEIANDTGAKVTLLHAIDNLCGFSTAYCYPGVSDVEKKLRSKAMARLANLAKKLGIPESNQVVRAGLPKPVILDEADKLGADLIIVGTNRRRGVKSFFGSVASTILRNAKCDTLVVHVDQ